MTEKNPAAVSLGKLGGDKTAEKHGPEFFQRLGKLGGAATKASGVDYAALGAKGGAVVALRGREYFQAIGRKGGAAVKAKGTDYRALGRLGGQKVKRALELLAETEKAAGEPPKAV